MPKSRIQWLIATGILGGGTASPNISVSGTTAFGSSPIGTTVSQVLTIQNTGNATLTIGTITASGSSFTITAQAGSSSLAPNATTTFTVRMEALAADAVAGAVSSTISIPNNSSTNPKTVAVSGTITILTTNLVSWYDASDASTLFQDSAGTTPATANADVIGKWSDKSGNAYHVTQATTANKPSLRTSVQNSRNVVRGDGSDDFMTNTSYPDFGDVFSAYVVMKYTTGGDTSQGIFEVVTAADASATGFGIRHTTQSFAFARDASATRNAFNGDLRDSVFRLNAFINIGTQIQSSINGGASVNTAYTAPNPNTLAHLWLFADLSGGRLLGDIAEVLIYSSNHDSTQQSNMKAYLNAKWAVY